jgi:methyl-accepting chemotaxis protein
MDFFKNIRISKKISVLSLSFFVFLCIIGFSSVTQISRVYYNVRELNDNRLIPIVELATIRSDIEYVRTQLNSLMD